MESKPLNTKALLEVEPPANLCSAIKGRISTTHIRTARIHCASLTVVCFLSGMLLVPLAQSIGRELYTSGFYDFASLIFSHDTGIISRVGFELAYSLMESLPALSVLCAGIIFGILFWSLRKIFLLRKAARLPYTNLLWS